MDLSKYIRSHFVKLADVEHNPIEDRIAGVTDGKYGPNLVLECGDIINLNKTNARTLAKAWGKNSEDWIAKEVRAFAGELPYDGRTKLGVVLEPISPALKPDEQTKPDDDGGSESQPMSAAEDFDDEIPF
jgi:hypothetical protein